MDDKKFDLVIILAIFTIASLLSLYFKFAPLIVGTLTLLLPSIYLLFRKKENLKKIYVAVLVFGGLFGFFFDFIVTYNNGWYVSDLIVPIRLFGFLPVDDLLGFLLMTLFIIVFYEHFLNDYSLKEVSPRILYVIKPALVVIGLILILYFLYPSLLTIPYVYLVTGIVAIMKLIKVGMSKKKFIIKFVYLSIFFFFIWFALELICLQNGGWYFPGQYIGIVKVANLTFPIEEFVFWFMLYAATIVAYYEYYEDGLVSAGR